MPFLATRRLSNAGLGDERLRLQWLRAAQMLGSTLPPASSSALTRKGGVLVTSAAPLLLSTSRADGHHLGPAAASSIRVQKPVPMARLLTPVSNLGSIAATGAETAAQPARTALDEVPAYSAIHVGQQAPGADALVAEQAPGRGLSSVLGWTRRKSDPSHGVARAPDASFSSRGGATGPAVRAPSGCTDRTHTRIDAGGGRRC
jgi:hypothetical protein